MSESEKSASEQIDAIVAAANDWRGKTLASLRAVILQTNPDLVEEVKWKKPSKPEGVPVWSLNGNICIGEMLKNAVRLTFPKGAQLADPNKLFNTRLDGNAVRAIDFSEDMALDEAGLKALIDEAVSLNEAKN
ncbi:MAG TPA: DUF1801 domain-containing protein [Candidatus Microsaccharimonas sp.]|nr:DUF1801 domain-containing protein [Candidatus Microsaccharimonas sp.]